MAKHWSEVYSCQCGKTFRSYAAEAFHRHNFPALCKQKKIKEKRVVFDAAAEQDGQGYSPDYHWGSKIND